MEISSIDESDVDFNISLEDEFRSIDRLIEQANEFLNDYNINSSILADDTLNCSTENIGSVSNPVINISESIQEIPDSTFRHPQSPQANLISYQNDDDDVICVDVQSAPIIDFIDLCSPSAIQSTAHRTTKRTSRDHHYNAVTEERHESVDEPQNKRAKELTCRICFESLFDRVTMSTSCGHMFCKTCLDQVLKIQKKCPLCKHPLKKNQVFRIYL